MGVKVREKDGAWWIFINHQGKRKAKRIGTGETGRKAAREAAGKIQAKLALGDLSLLEPTEKAKPSPTFKAVAADWERVTAPNWKRGTVITYGKALRSRLLPAFGKLRISDVTADRVEAWWTARREEGLSRKHLSTLRNILRAICRRAVSLGLLRSNPVERIEGRLGRETGEIVKKSDYLTPADLTTFLGTAGRIAPREYPIFLVMGTCGLRIGEALGLQVGDLDVPGLRLHIRRTVRRGYVDSPKNGKVGIVDVPASTMTVLANVRDIRQVEAAVRGTEARWLFPSRRATDMPKTPEAVQNLMRVVLRAAGLRKIRPHDLRHTYATLAIQAGVPLLTVSRQLRHASISTTADIYAHAVPGDNRAAADSDGEHPDQQPNATPAQPHHLTPRIFGLFVKVKIPSRCANFASPLEIRAFGSPR